MGFLENITTEEILKNGLLELNHTPTPELCLKLNAFINELSIFNAKFNLIKVENKQEIAVKHILDSLAGLRTFLTLLQENPSYKTIADVGAGAGFPSIPLAIALSALQPDVKITLIERMKKRCTFLQNVKAMLGLQNIEIFEQDAGKTSKKFDIITCRAFAPLDLNSLNLFRLLQADSGITILYKGSPQKTQAELNSLMPSAKSKIVPLKLPYWEGERCLLCVHL